MRLNPTEIRDAAKADYRKAWIETAGLIPKSGGDFPASKGNTHRIHELIGTVRRVFLDMGFDEVENQIFIPEEDVYKQYGPEAPVILDRCYYLGGLTRPDIGLSSEKIEQVKAVADANPDILKGIFRRYREGEVEGDNVLETMVSELSISTDQAARILGLFPEFREVKPVCGNTTLRSHMTAAWFPTLAAVQEEAPARLFSVGLRFRREQKVDSSHLRAHYGGSCVIMSEDISLEAGRKATEKILNALDFGDVRFVKKKATSNYYAPDTEYEVYSGEIEVADIGMYSPVALAQYGISYNVFNLGFGLERILMVKEGLGDVREVLYPQFYQKAEYTDAELAREVSIQNIPHTVSGKALAKALKKTFMEHGDRQSPCSFIAYDGDFTNKHIIVEAVEKEDGSRLCGPAYKNEIIVYGSGVYGVPRDTSKLKLDVKDIVEKGVNCGFTFMDAVCNGLAYEIEKRMESGEHEGFAQVKMAKSPADVNVKLSGKARRYIESKNKPISFRGPVFCAAQFKTR